MEIYEDFLKTVFYHKDFTFHPYCRKLRLIHLLFAGDLMLFCKVELGTLRYLMDALNYFHITSGLRANLAKYNIVLEGCSARYGKTALPL